MEKLAVRVCQAYLDCLVHLVSPESMDYLVTP